MASSGNNGATQSSGAGFGQSRWTLDDPAPEPDQGLPLPVINRGAAYAPANTQGVVPVPTNAQQERARIEALRNQLRTPWAIGETMMKFYLNRAGWDVNRAAELFWTEQGGRPANPPAPAPRRDAWYGSTVGNARRRQIVNTRARDAFTFEQLATCWRSVDRAKRQLQGSHRTAVKIEQACRGWCRARQASGNLRVHYCCRELARCTSHA